MDALPPELREEILQNLRFQDVKSIRFASKSWAELARPYLILPTFVLIPHRHDFGRLLLLSQHPGFAPRVKKLEFVMGELDEYHARNNMFFVQYVRDPEERDHEFQGAWAEYARLKNQKEALADKCCDPDLLGRTFKCLPNLRSIEVNLVRCPFQHPLLQRIWQIPTTTLLPRVSAIRRFSRIIHAARHLRLDSLVHDCLLFEAWSHRNVLEDIPAAFQGIRSLKISLDYNAFANSLQSGTGSSDFRTALCATPNL